MFEKGTSEKQPTECGNHMPSPYYSEGQGTFEQHYVLLYIIATVMFRYINRALLLLQSKENPQ